MSKEFARFFKDRRMIIMTLAPALFIYVAYTFMGTALASVFAPDEDHTPWVYAVNMPDTVAGYIQGAGVSILHIEPGETGAVKDRITQKEIDLCMVFPSDFDEKVEAYDVRTATGPAPNIEVYYNSTEPNSQAVYYTVIALLDSYESSLANKFDVNREVENVDLATAEDISATIIATLMPMLLMIFLFSGCMGLALESITGEKERGTLATLLVSPLKRSELAVGKILSLAALSFLSGSATAVATILSLPNLMGGGDEMIDAGIYGVTEYALLALVILTALLLMVALISIISAFAKTVKEAGQAVMPLMIIIMLVGVSGMFGGGPQADPVYYLVPLYSSVQSMSGIFSLDYTITNIALSCLSSLAYACIGGFVLTKMFNSEKIMFSR